MNDRRPGPAKQGRDDQPDAFAGTRRRKRHDMLGAVVAQIAPVERSEERTGIVEQPGRRDVAPRGPPRRAIGGDVTLLARTPQRPANRSRAADKSASACDGASPVEYVRCIGIKVIPPCE